MLDDDLGLLRQVRRMQRHVASERTGGFAFGQDRVVGGKPVGQPVVRLVGGVVGQHVEDEPLLNRLAHRVQVERHVPLLPGRIDDLLAEHFQCLRLRCGGEREEGQVVLLAARLGRRD